MNDGILRFRMHAIRLSAEKNICMFGTVTSSDSDEKINIVRLRQVSQLIKIVQN